MPKSSMKAIVYDRYGGPEELELVRIPVPEPGKGQVRVKVLACGVNLSDWEHLTGSPFYARLVGGLRRPKQPVLGSDIVGIVEKHGSGVIDPPLGQRVMGDFVMIRGGFAEYVCVPADALVNVPDCLTDEIAACLPQAGGIAVAGTDGLEKGRTFLINGAGGGSGTMALQLAKAAGAHVTAIDNSEKIDWIKELGADEVIDYGRVNFTTVNAKWSNILDMVATRGCMQVSKSLSAGGVYKAVGGKVLILLSVVFGGLLYKFQNKSIGMLFVPAGKELTERVALMCAERKLNPKLEEVLPLSSVPDALRRTGRGEVKGKLVIQPWR